MVVHASNKIVPASVIMHLAVFGCDCGFHCLLRLYLQELSMLMQSKRYATFGTARANLLSLSSRVSIFSLHLLIINVDRAAVYRR